VIESRWVNDIQLVITERKPPPTPVVRPGPPAGLYQLKDSADLSSAIEDHSTALGLMKQSPYSKPFRAKIIHWLRVIGFVEDISTACLLWEALAQSLESVFAFHSDNLRSAMKAEAELFDDANYELTDILGAMALKPLAIEACADSSMLLERLASVGAKLEFASKALVQFIEKTRKVFPRFYFLSDSEILRIQGTAKEPDSLAPMLSKVFAGVATLEFALAAVDTSPLRPVMPAVAAKPGLEVVAVSGADGERVKLVKGVSIDSTPETWLSELELIFNPRV
jgi:dynein heavy chain, axonemal